MRQLVFDDGEPLVEHPNAANLPPDDPAVLVPRLLAANPRLIDLARGPVKSGGPRAAAIGASDITQWITLITTLLPHILQLINQARPPAQPPGPPPVHGDVRPPEPPDLGEGEPTEGRTAVDFNQHPHWITRKKSMEENTGRYLVSDGEKFEIWDGRTPAMQGDRVCVDNTPIDQNGRKFQPGDAANANIRWEHEGLGVGEKQQQEEVDFTPQFLVPWKGLPMDSKHTAGLKSTMLFNNKRVKTKEHTIRVHVRGLD